MLTPLQSKVLSTLNTLLTEEGFAIGGGVGLQAHGVMNRDSSDIDAYTTKFDPSLFVRVEEEICSLLVASDLEVTLLKTQDVFRGFVVRDPFTGEETVVDLGYDYRTYPPVVNAIVGPVLDIEDILVGKMRAFVDRRAERDYYDIDAAIRTGRWTIEDLWVKTIETRPEVTRGKFASFLRDAQELDPVPLLAYGMTVEGVADMVTRFQGYASDIMSLQQKDKPDDNHT